LSLQASLILWVSLRYISPTLIIYRLLPLCTFFIFCIALTGIVSVVLALLSYPSLSYSISFFTVWSSWWLSNLNGILTLAIGIITWDMYFPQISVFKQINKYRLSAYYGALLISIIALIFSDTLAHIIIVSIITVSLMSMISWRYGWSGSVCGILLMTLMLSLFTAKEMSIFLQSLLSLSAIIGLLVAVIQNRLTDSRFAR